MNKSNNNDDNDDNYDNYDKPMDNRHAINEQPNVGILDHGDETVKKDEYYDIVINNIKYTCNKNTNKVYVQKDDYLVAVGRITSKGELKLKKKKNNKE